MFLAHILIHSDYIKTVLSCKNSFEHTSLIYILSSNHFILTEAYLNISFFNYSKIITLNEESQHRFLLE